MVNPAGFTFILSVRDYLVTNRTSGYFIVGGMMVLENWICLDAMRLQILVTMERFFFREDSEFEKLEVIYEVGFLIMRSLIFIR